MNVLVFTTLFPNDVQARHGIFIENRVKELIKRYPDVKVTVVAPVPYFPSFIPISNYAEFANVSNIEHRNGYEVFHPKYLVIPKIGMNITPFFLYHTAKRLIRSLQARGYEFDVIDAHYFYPDGVVANWLAKTFNLPVSVTARGSDINVIPDNKIAKKRIVEALASNDANVAVGEVLASKVDDLYSQANCQVLRNGVDLDVFRPYEKATCIEKIGLPEGFENKIIISIGNLIPLKGHHLVIEALRDFPDCRLIILGEGNYRNHLEQLINELNLQDRVFLPGNIEQKMLPFYYSLADVKVLASSREGLANVLLESLACGTPVLATNVGGAKEVVSSEIAGEVIEERSVSAISQGLTRILGRKYERKAISKYAERFSWATTSKLQYELLSKLKNEGRQNG